MPVHLAKKVIPYRDFIERVAFYDCERANYSQTDILLAQLCVMFETVNSGKGSKKAKISDYLPELKVKTQSKEQFDCNLKLFRSMLRGKK